MTYNPSKVEYYLNIAEAVGKKSTCLKKKWGCIIVKDNIIVSTGYNGAPRKILDCETKGICSRENSERGTDYAFCPAVHSEQNAIIFGNRADMKDADMYLVGIEMCHPGWRYVQKPAPCSLCKRMIINAGIKRVFVRTEKNQFECFDVTLWNENDITGGY